MMVLTSFPGRSAAWSSCGTVRCRAGAVQRTVFVTIPVLTKHHAVKNGVLRRARETSLDPQVRVVHHLAPFLDLEFYSRGNFVRRIGPRAEAEIGQPLPHFWARHALFDLARQQI